MPINSDTAASSGTVRPRKAMNMTQVISPMATNEAIVESLIASEFSSASMAGMPVTPQ